MTNLCGDDVELKLLPVVVGLFECLNLAQNQDIEQEGRKITEVNLHRHRSRSACVPEVS